MNPLLTALIVTLLLASPCLHANPFYRLGRCGVQGRSLTVSNDSDPVLRQGEYFEVLRLDDHLCDELTWLFLADPDLYVELNALHRAGVQIILYIPSPFDVGGQTSISNGVSVRPHSPTIKLLFPSLDFRKSTLFISPSTSLYDLHHEVRHLRDFLKFLPSVAASLSGLNLKEFDYLAAFLFVLELRAYGRQLVKLEQTERGLDFLYDSEEVRVVPGPPLRRRLSKSHASDFRHLYAQPLRQSLDRLGEEDSFAQKCLARVVRYFVSADDIRVTGVGDLLPEVVPCQADLIQ